MICRNRILFSYIVSQNWYYKVFGHGCICFTIVHILIFIILIAVLVFNNSTWWFSKLKKCLGLFYRDEFRRFFARVSAWIMMIDFVWALACLEFDWECTWWRFFLSWCTTTSRQWVHLHSHVLYASSLLSFCQLNSAFFSLFRSHRHSICLYLLMTRTANWIIVFFFIKFWCHNWILLFVSILALILSAKQVTCLYSWWEVIISSFRFSCRQGWLFEYIHLRKLKFSYCSLVQIEWLGVLLTRLFGGRKADHLAGFLTT